MNDNTTPQPTGFCVRELLNCWFISFHPSNEILKKAERLGRPRKRNHCLDVVVGTEYGNCLAPSEPRGGKSQPVEIGGSRCGGRDGIRASAHCILELSYYSLYFFISGTIDDYLYNLERHSIHWPIYRSLTSCSVRFWPPLAHQASPFI